MVKKNVHTLAAVLEEMAAILKIHVATTFFLQSDPKGTCLPNIMLVSQFERFGQKMALICSTILLSSILIASVSTVNNNINDTTKIG